MKLKFETDCEIPFAVSCKIKINGTKLCEIDLEDGYTLTYMPVPDDIRFCFSSIIKFYKTDEGQKLIKDKLKK